MWKTGISRVYNNAAVELNWNDLETDNNFFGERSGQIAGGHKRCRRRQGPTALQRDEPRPRRGPVRRDPSAGPWCR